MLSEGLWRFNNSTLNRINTTDNTTELNYFENTNGFKIGDVAQDIIQLDSTFLILVSGSGLILECDYNGKFKRSYTFQKYGYLKAFDKIDESRLAITDLDASKIYIFDYLLFKILSEVNTGPGPDDIEIFKNFIFTANSAKGVIFDNQEGARTVSVIDANLNQEINQLKSGPNTLSLEIDKDNSKLYVGYTNFRWENDSIGGIIKYDIATFSKENEWKSNVYSDLKLKGNYLYFLNGSGLNRIEVTKKEDEESFILNETEDIWYEFDFDDENIFIFNAKNHTTEGELNIYDWSGNKKGSYQTGINPKKILKLNI